MKFPPIIWFLAAVGIGVGVWYFLERQQPAPTPQPSTNGDVIVDQDISSKMAASEQRELLERANNYEAAAEMTGSDDENHDFLLKANAKTREAGRDRYRKLMKWETTEGRSEVHKSVASGLRKAAGRK